MRSIVQSWFAPAANPVGIDFGTDCLRLAQVDTSEGEFRLVAAASAEVPSLLRTDLASRLSFFTNTLNELWVKGSFRGHRAILALPAAAMHIQHLRLPRLDDDSIKKALPWELQGKLSIDPSQALLRHVVAGDVYSGQEPRSEVIAMAADQQFVEQLLAAAVKARIEVVGMHVEPKAIIDCFLHVYRRQAGADAVNYFVDIGGSGSRAVIARGGQILFARAIPIGGVHFDRALAVKHEVSVDEARALRLGAVGSDGRHRDTGVPPAREAQTLKECDCSEPEHAAHGRDAHVTTRDATRIAQENPEIQNAIREPLNRLVEELSLCRRYYDAAFPAHPVQRLIFVGGEARQRCVCVTIARNLGIAAQIGDPLVRMARTTQVGIESGIDRRQPQPAWAVAIGLSMGSPQASAVVNNHHSSQSKESP